MPVERAINLCFLLHLIWLGWGMALWGRGLGLHPGAAAIAGLVLPLSGPVFPHLYAGHMSNICTMAWAPWILLGFHHWVADGRRRGLLMAGAAAAMQVLAGHVQYAFYTAIGVALYAALRSPPVGGSRRRALAGLAGLYGGAAALSAVQLLPSLSAAAEGLHRGRLDFSYVRTFSFPPENLITLVAPTFFGGMSVASGEPLYWGRAYLWEMTLYAGICGIVLALVALHERIRASRLGLLPLLIPALLFVLALGAHTPLLRLLYDWVPGFGGFRGLAKFTFPLMLFVTLAIGWGADALIRGRTPGRVAGLTMAGSAIALTGIGVSLRSFPENAAPWLAGVRDTLESGLPPGLFTDPEFIRAAGHQAGESLATAAVVLTLVAASVLCSTRWPRLRVMPLLLLPVEMVLFAATSLETSVLGDAVPRECRTFVADRPGDYRLINTMFPNNGFLLGVPDAGGNDPAVLRRYAEFVVASEGGDPDDATQHLPLRRLSPALAMLRVRFAMVSQPDGIHFLENHTIPLPRLLLLSDYRVLPTRDAILFEMFRDTFNPRRTVFLERVPDPVPVPGASGTARVLSETSDTVEIDVETTAPVVLLVTDQYSRDWRARALSPGPQAEYDVLPANYVLRGIPLAAGRHHLILEYEPSLLVLGAFTSVLALAVWGGAWRRARSEASLLSGRSMR
jgi:hypothetical protein